MWMDPEAVSKDNKITTELNRGCWGLSQMFAQRGGASGRGRPSGLLIHASIPAAEEETDEQPQVFQVPSCRKDMDSLYN